MTGFDLSEGALQLAHRGHLDRRDLFEQRRHTPLVVTFGSRVPGHDKGAEGLDAQRCVVHFLRLVDVSLCRLRGKGRVRSLGNERLLDASTKIVSSP